MTALCSFGCMDLANHRKRWDAKPEATGPQALCSFGCMQANRRKRRDAKPETKGSFVSLALCSIGYRTIFASEHFCKERK